MPESPELSVVIPTYNRRDRLGRVLGSLERQADVAGRFEVVVVDDGSSDGTSDFLRSYRPPFPLIPIRQENGGPARARNAGVDAARAPLLLFLDDDVVPEPDLLREHLASHVAAPNLAVMGPLASLPSYAQPWVAWEQVQLEKQYAAMQRGDWAPTYRQFWTGNASLAKARIVEAGGFDSEFLRAEDVELAYRMHVRGLGFSFNPRAVGMHHAERSLPSWMLAQRSYGALDARMLLLRGEEHLVSILSGNWSRLSRSGRGVVGTAVRHPVGAKAAIEGLRRALDAGGPAAWRPLAHRLCSALANLLYWTALAEGLEPRLVELVLRRGEELAAGGNR